LLSCCFLISEMLFTMFLYLTHDHTHFGLGPGLVRHSQLIFGKSWLDYVIDVPPGLAISFLAYDNAFIHIHPSIHQQIPHNFILFLNFLFLLS
jgi:hypothetical protein